MRFVIYGAGAIGGVIGARLRQHRQDVVLIARGAHLRAIRERGLRVESPSGTATVEIPAVDHPSQLTFSGDDVIVLAMKTQDTAAALAALAGLVDRTVPIACAQNGVDNERQALRLFRNVYGVAVMCPSAYLEPGVVQAYGQPHPGVLDVGRYPRGVDATVTSLSAALTGAGFASRTHDAILAFKYGKLLFNLGNAVEAVCGPEGRKGPLVDLARREALAVYEAAGIAFERNARDRAEAARPVPIGVTRRPGGSSWQSLQRRLGSIETDYLNGEVVLLGRLCGVPTPVNETLQSYAGALARGRSAPGAVSTDALLAEIEARRRA